MYGVESEIARQIREGYEAFNRGDYDTVLRSFSNDFEAFERDEIPDPQHYEGLDGARQAFANAAEMFDEYEIEPREYIEGDGRHVVVVAHQRGRGKASGASVEGEIVHVWTVDHGRTSGLRAFSSKRDALDHLGWPSS
jgi:ketosteroid isomerase-like protein